MQPRGIQDARIATPREVARTSNWDNYRFAHEFTDDQNLFYAEDWLPVNSRGPRHPIVMPPK
jgi:hypothetical protein